MKKIYTILISLVAVLCLGTGEVANAALSLGLKVYLCAIVEEGVNHTGWIAPSQNALLRISDTTVITKTSFNSTQLANYIKSANIFEIHTHGTPTKLIAIEGSVKSELNKSVIDGWSAGTLSSLKLAYLCGCNTGGIDGTLSDDQNANSNAYTDNLVNSMFSKGARCVIGNKKKVYIPYTRIMLQNFNVALGYGYTIQNALAYADAQVLAAKGATGGTDSRLVRGDTSVKFKEVTESLRGGSLNQSSNMIYFTNEEGIYGYFDVSKMSQADKSPSIQMRSNDQIEKDIAEDFIMSKVTNFDKYTLNYQNYVEDTGLTTYVYSYYIDNINTDDYIFVMVNNNSEIVSYGLPNEGKFDSIDLDEFDLDQTRVLLSQTLQEKEIDDYEVLEERLVIENDVLSIRYTVEYDSVQSEYECFEEVIVPLRER